MIFYDWKAEEKKEEEKSPAPARIWIHNLKITRQVLYCSATTTALLIHPVNYRNVGCFAINKSPFSYFSSLLEWKKWGRTSWMRWWRQSEWWSVVSKDLAGNSNSEMAAFPAHTYTGLSWMSLRKSFAQGKYKFNFLLISICILLSKSASFFKCGLEALVQNIKTRKPPNNRRLPPAIGNFLANFYSRNSTLYKQLFKLSKQFLVTKA